MKYFQELDLDCSVIIDKLRKFYLYNETVFNTTWTDLNVRVMRRVCPELFSMFEEINLTVQTMSFITLNTQFGQIHSDQTKYSSRINIPVLNCENTETKFFKSDSQFHMVKWNEVAIPSFNAEECIQVDSFCLSKPTVLRVNEIHQICSYNVNLPRVSCTVGFVEDIEYLYETGA